MPDKVCPNCKNKLHPRVKLCKCGHKFVFKSKNKYKRVNWQDLKKDDIIKVAGGPFWINLKGSKVLMGYKGRYKVVDLDQNGILAYGLDKSGFCHIWMKEKIITDDGIVKIPHKIKKINS
jgi:hypothetical protein